MRKDRHIFTLNNRKFIHFLCLYSPLYRYIHQPPLCRPPDSTQPLLYCFPNFPSHNTKFCYWLNLLLSKFITIMLTTISSLRFESFIFYLKFCHSSVFFLQCILFIFFHLSEWLPYSCLPTIYAKCYILCISKNKNSPSNINHKILTKIKQSMQKQKYTDIFRFVFVKSY